MKQHEAVIQVMRENGGFATLALLNRRALAVRGSEWRTKTPYASIRRIVQDPRFFFKIRPGLWALKSERDNVLQSLFESQQQSREKMEAFDHTYYQGLLVELGNCKSFDTYVPSQDKNRKFLNKPLSQVATLHEFKPFTYDSLIKRGRTIDVTWFNARGFPACFFEVEHSTDIQNSLLKFLDFQDFNVEFRIVANSVRTREFDKKLNLTAFGPISKRVKLLSYELLSDYHAKTSDVTALADSVGL